MYQLTNFSDSAFAYKVANKINKDYKKEASVQSKVLDNPLQEAVYPNGHRFIPVGTEVTACFVTNKYWDFCKSYVQEKCKIKSEVIE